jgi:site-specific recombinase XerD
VAAELAATDIVTLGQALDRTYREHWCESKSGGVMRHMVNVLTRDLGTTRLRDCSYRALKDYCEQLKEDGLANATINRRMSAIGVTLREASRRGECERPDMPHYTENNKRERYMTEQEEQNVGGWLKVRSMADNYGTPGTGEWVFMRCLFVVLVDTGMRFSETFKAVLTKDGVLRLGAGETKSGKARSIPLTRRAVDCWNVMQQTGFVSKLAVDPNAWAWVDHRWKQAVAGGGCPDITLHVLRHTCASRLIQRGVDLFTVSKWLGHSSMKVTERYAHLAPETLSRALSALERAPVPVEEPSRASLTV